MSLQDQINEDWKNAMKARDPSKDALGLIRTELKNCAIQTREPGSKNVKNTYSFCFIYIIITYSCFINFKTNEKNHMFFNQILITIY